jgi:plasmid stabilization system protein ParE
MIKLDFEFDDEAELEFYDIIDHYKKIERSLSAKFIHEFTETVQYLLDFPKVGSPYLHGTKRMILRRFPYAIVYKIYHEKVIVVYAVMHMSRKKDYWKERLK